MPNFVAYQHPATLTDFMACPPGLLEPVDINAVGFIEDVLDAYLKKQKVPAGWDGKAGKYYFLHRYGAALALMYDAFDGTFLVSPY